MATQQLSKERVELATQREHFEQAFRLVYREYLRKGYCAANPFQMRIILHNALPETVTFCLWRNDILLGTASVVADSPMGLPMEDVYPDEVRTLRNKGRKLCEVSLLALNSEVIGKGILPLYFAERLRALFHLFKPIFWYARKTLGFTDLCIAMNPTHKMLYSSLHFEQFGGEKVYQSVNGNPSIAMRLNFDDIDERGKKTPGLYKLFIGKSLEIPRITDIFHWNAEDFDYFFIENSNILKNAKQKQIEYLTYIYPKIPIRHMLEKATSNSNYGQPPIRRCA